MLAGFKAGTGLLIAAGQLGKVLGIDQTGDNFFEKMGSALSQLDDIDWGDGGAGGGDHRAAARAQTLGAGACRARSWRSAWASPSARRACSTWR